MLELAAGLRCGLDPVRFSEERLNFTPDPWQAEVLRCSGNVLLNCSRQAGKSTVTAILAAHTALYRPGALILLGSPSLRQSRELFAKVSDFLGKLETATKDLEEGGRVGKLLDTETINVSYKKDLIHRLQERILAGNHDSTDSEDGASGKQGPHKAQQLAKTLGGNADTGTYQIATEVRAIGMDKFIQHAVKAAQRAVEQATRAVEQASKATDAAEKHAENTRDAIEKAVENAGDAQEKLAENTRDAIPTKDKS